MRPIATLLALFLACAAAGADPLSGFRFADGKDRSLASFGGEPVVVVYFCAHCPSAAKFLGNEAKQLHDWLEAKHVRARLVLATPELQPADLATLDKDRGYGMPEALYAQDPGNTKQISLNNILQYRLIHADGRDEMFAFNEPIWQQTLGGTKALPYRFPPDGVDDAQVKALWWAVERGKPQAIKQLAAAAKSKKSPAQAQAAALHARVAETLAARQAELVAAEPSLAAVEALEAFLAEAEGTDTKAAAARWKALKADKSLKDELKARDIWLQCRQMLASPKPDQQKAGKEGLAALAKKLPETVYGRKAAAQ